MSTYQHADRRPIADIFRYLADAPVRWCTRLKVHPNTVSYASIVASSLAAVSFVLASRLPALLIVGVVFCFVRLYFNMLDGMVAIATNKACATGEVANELPDRISDVLIFVGVAHSGLCHPLLGYWAAIMSLLVAYVGTLGQAVGAQREFAGPMSKPWRIVVLAVGAVGTWFFGRADLPLPAFNVTFLDVASSVVVLGCVATVFRRLRRTILKLTEKSAKRGGL